MTDIDAIARRHANEVHRATAKLAVPVADTRRPAPLRALFAFGFGSAVIVLLAVPLIWMNLVGEHGEDPVVPPGAPATTLPVEPGELGPNLYGHVIPLDGAPELLGVTEMDFVAAMLPTTPEEMRVHAAWEAMRFNVEQQDVAECMALNGFELTPGRFGAPYFLRQIYIPDFESEATQGLAWSLEWESRADPASSDINRESDEWQEAYSNCSLRLEAERSVFDMHAGVTGEWWETIASVNISPAMRVATKEMLQCVANAGGPDAPTIGAWYTATKDVIEGRAPEYEVPAAEHPGLFHECSLVLTATRAEILGAMREDFLKEDRVQIMFEGQSYFDSIVARSGFEG